MCLGGLENKILYFDPIFFPKNGNFRAIFDGTSKISTQKGLNNGDAPSKLPLIVIVRPFHESCIVNRQIWVWEFKDGVTDDPYLQVTWPSQILDQISAQKGFNNGDSSL